MTIYRLIGLDFSIEFRASLGLASASGLEIPTGFPLCGGSRSSSSSSRTFPLCAFASCALSSRKDTGENKTCPRSRASPSIPIPLEESRIGSRKVKGLTYAFRIYPHLRGDAGLPDFFEVRGGRLLKI